MSAVVLFKHGLYDMGMTYSLFSQMEMVRFDRSINRSGTAM